MVHRVHHVVPPSTAVWHTVTARQRLHACHLHQHIDSLGHVQHPLVGLLPKSSAAAVIFAIFFFFHHIGISTVILVCNYYTKYSFSVPQ